MKNTEIFGLSVAVWVASIIAAFVFLPLGIVMWMASIILLLLSFVPKGA